MGFGGGLDVVGGLLIAALRPVVGGAAAFLTSAARSISVTRQSSSSSSSASDVLCTLALAFSTMSRLKPPRVSVAGGLGTGADGA